jgi:tripartite-type tricarboxylate transporter receptor subunit TctC
MKFNTHRSRSLFSTLGIMVMALGNHAVAQTATTPAWPSKPIRMIVPTGPGSPPDVVARIIGERLVAALGQPVVVENRPGAIGTIALNAVAKATPDGYTFGITALAYQLAPTLLPNVPFDMVADLAPVTQTNWESFLLVVRASSALKSVKDIVAQAKSQPDRMTFASGGNATPAHLSGEFFKRHSGINIRHVPFKGAPDGVAAVVGGEVDLMFAATAAAVPHIQSGRLRVLATPAPSRLPAFADVPTMVELGFTGVEIRSWLGVVAPRATPKVIIEKMASEIAKIGASPDVKARFATLGMETATEGGSAAFGALIRAEFARWSRVARDAGLRAE